MERKSTSTTAKADGARKRPASTHVEDAQLISAHARRTTSASGCPSTATAAALVSMAETQEGMPARKHADTRQETIKRKREVHVQARRRQRSTTHTRDGQH